MTAHDELDESDVRAPVIGEVTRTDAALAAVASVASVIPLIGGPTAAVASELRRSFDRRQAERLAAVVDDLSLTLRALADRIKRDLGEDGQFALFLEAAIESAASARNAEKRRFYVALMARSTIIGGPEDLQLTLLLDTLDRLRYSHLTLLHAVATGPRPTSNRDYSTEGTPGYVSIRSAMPGIDDIFLHRAWEDMVALGLLTSWTDYLVTEELPIDESGDPVTLYGREFLEFVSPF